MFINVYFVKYIPLMIKMQKYSPVRNHIYDSYISSPKRTFTKTVLNGPTIHLPCKRLRTWYLCPNAYTWITWLKTVSPPLTLVYNEMIVENKLIPVFMNMIFILRKTHVHFSTINVIDVNQVLPILHFCGNFPLALSIFQFNVPNIW